MREMGHLAAAVMLLLTSTAASAETPAGRYQLDIPEAELASALKTLAVETGIDLVAPAELVEGRRVRALHGAFTVDEAVNALLEGTGLTFTRTNGVILVARPSDDRAGPGKRPPGGEKASDIIVTGTRIRGAPVAAPVIRISEEAIRDRGQATLAEAIRDIPQNFGGGQNPGVGNNVPASNGVNVGSASSINLRGLGSDATLTLINGHRISYSASRQAVDISAIPLGAVDRIEVVPDGASALYGSDAVAGVVNIVLKRDFDGLEASARLGGSTDGGDFEQRYDLTAGHRWSGGGFIASFEHGSTSAILGRDRSYTAKTAPALTLSPSIRNWSATLSGHQDLGDRAEFDLDAFFNDRSSTSSYALNAQGDIRASGARFAYDARSFAIAPTLKFRPAGDWDLFLTGSYARDRTHYDVKSYFAGQVLHFPNNCYCNSAALAELGGDGTLFAAPGGPAKLAAGLGYRTNTLVRFNGDGASTNISKTQDSYYVYGEFSLPLISPEQQIPLIDRLSLSAAGRYERYPGIGGVFTPKLAAIYSPSADFDLKASWGKSFRAPTLYQQYQAVNVVLAPPFVFGGSGFPDGSTALLLQGGNPDLKPERATSWSATWAIHPRKLEGARLELSYFSTRYKDRVVTPIAFLSQALSNPIYADRLTFDPSAELQAAVIAGAASFGNATGAPYDPSAVAVFIDDSNVNAGFQHIDGADLLLGYDAPLSEGLGKIHVSLDATYLRSKQQLDPLQPVLPMAGILFNPPHFSARADVAWMIGSLTLNGGMSHTGGVRDTRVNPSVDVHGMTTFDLTARLKSARGSSFFSGIDASLSVQNIFNAKPALIATSLPSDAPYDSTNYSPVGRFVAVSLSKAW